MGRESLRTVRNFTEAKLHAGDDVRPSTICNKSSGASSPESTAICVSIIHVLYWSLVDNNNIAGVHRRIKSTERWF